MAMMMVKVAMMRNLDIGRQGAVQIPHWIESFIEMKERCTQ